MISAQTSLWIFVPGGGSVAALWFRWETYARCIALTGALFYWKMNHVRRTILDSDNSMTYERKKKLFKEL